MNTTQTVEIVEVVLADSGPLTSRGSRWIVKANGRPVANYQTRAGAERKAAQVTA